MHIWSSEVADLRQATSCAPRHAQHLLISVIPARDGFARRTSLLVADADRLNCGLYESGRYDITANGLEADAFSQAAAVGAKMLCQPLIGSDGRLIEALCTVEGAFAASVAQSQNQRSGPAGPAPDVSMPTTPAATLMVRSKMQPSELVPLDASPEASTPTTPPATLMVRSKTQPSELVPLDASPEASIPTTPPATLMVRSKMQPSELVPLDASPQASTSTTPAATSVHSTPSAEMSVRATDKQLLQFYEWLPHPVMLIAQSLELVSTNQAFEHMCGQGHATVVSCVHPDDLCLLHQAWQHQVARPFCLEIRLHGTDKQYRWHELQCQPLRHGTQQEQAQDTWLALAHNIQQFKEREARLEANCCVRKNFLTVASHELSTPLTSLHLNLQLALQRLAAHREASAESVCSLDRALQRSMRETRRLEEVVGDILDAARVQAGRLSLNCTEVSLNHIVTETLHLFERPFAESGCRVNCSIDSKIKGLWDPQRLGQVFFNLCANVVKHAPGSIVHIAAKASKKRVLVTLGDDGPGIEACFHRSIFRRFERATQVRGVSGLGLGLYLCREIVAEHGGRMRVASAPGQGALFKIVLPKSGPARQVDAAPISPAKQKMPGPRSSS